MPEWRNPGDLKGNGMQYRDWWDTKTLLVDVIAGFLNSLLIVFICVSLVIFCCGEFLRAYIPTMLGIALASSIVSLLTHVCRSSFTNIVSSIQDKPTIVLFLFITATYKIFADSPPEIFFATVFSAMILMTVLTSILVYCLSKLSLGNLIRYIPLPVIGGFLAGTGWLILAGIFPLIIKTSAPIQTMNLFPIIFSLPQMIHWVPVFVLGIGLNILLRKFNNPLLIPLSIIIVLPLFFIVLSIMHVSIDEAANLGLFLGPLDQSQLIHFPQLNLLLHADWGFILRNLDKLLLLLVLAPIVILMNLVGIEVITEKEADLNNELKLTGIANLVSPLLGGGFFSYPLVVGTVLNQRLGVRHRISGIISVILCLAVLITGTIVLNYIPEFIYLGIVLFLALDLMYEWLVMSWFRMTKKDYFIIISIFLVIALFSLFYGIIFGLVIFLLIFVWEYSRVNTLGDMLFSESIVSHSSYSQKNLDIISKFGHDVLITRLKGYMFFGNAHTAFEKIIHQLEDNPETRNVHYLILDFSSVHGMDSSSILSLKRLKRSAEKKKIIVSFVNLTKKMNTALLDQLERHGFSKDHYFKDINESLEWGNQHILADHAKMAEIDVSVAHNLLKKALKLTEEEYNILLNHLETITLTKNTLLIKQNEENTEIYFLLKGGLRLYTKTNEEEHNLLYVHPGAIVGELAYYTHEKRSAYVECVEDSTLFKLTEENFLALERERPRIALKLHNYIACMLSYDVKHANSLIYMLLHGE